MPDDIDEPDDSDTSDSENGLTPEAAATAARHRMVRSRDRWRDRLRNAEAQREQLQARVAELETHNVDVQQLRRSALRATIRSYAAGTVRPDALDDVDKLVDTSDLELGDDGSIDGAKLKAKLEELVKAKPFLAQGIQSRPNGAPRPWSFPAPPPQRAGPQSAINQALRAAANRNAPAELNGH